MADKILKKFQLLGKNRYIRVFRFVDYKPAVRFEKFKWEIQYDAKAIFYAQNR